ncbi:unnamed protein product [Phaeothamnion confervicola]
MAKDFDVEGGTLPIKGISSTLLTTLRPHLADVSGSSRLGPEGFSIAGLLEGSRLIFPEKVTTAEGERERGLRQEQRRRALLLRSEEREYQRLTSNVRGRGEGFGDVSDIQATFKFQAGIAANLILAVVSMFILGYWVSKYIGVKKDSHRLVVGMVCAVFIALVEVFIFVIRSLRADETVRRSQRLSSSTGRLFGPRASARGTEVEMAAQR